MPALPSLRIAKIDVTMYVSASHLLRYNIYITYTAMYLCAHIFSITASKQPTTDRTMHGLDANCGLAYTMSPLNCVYSVYHVLIIIAIVLVAIFVIYFIYIILYRLITCLATNFVVFFA